MLSLYNTLSRSKEIFQPIVPQQVRLYVCGMTVYDYCHLGHARVMVVFDMVQRWFKALGYQVTYVRNITDIDDKIINRAIENQESIFALTNRFIQAMHEDADALGVERPTHEPRATDSASIAGMFSLIKKLLDKNLAYQAQNGDVYYAVREFAGYGKLSGKSLDDLRAGERVEIDQSKRDPLDFVLWKAAKENEPQWDSPWGAGRPGWHIECSAMSECLLGAHFDIHGGGQDLQFPHHENEIAQSEGAHGHAYVNYWMHNGFVRVVDRAGQDEKMSKSLGNFFTIREVLAHYPAEVVRFFMLRAHYRSALTYSDAHLDDARASLTRLYTALKNVPVTAEIANAIDWQTPYALRFAQAMNDDFATSDAIAVLFELALEVNKTQSALLAQQLRQLAGVLGLLQQDAEKFLQTSVLQEDTLSTEAIEAHILARQAARAAKNFAESDRIREVLFAAGVVLEDGAGKTGWRWK